MSDAETISKALLSIKLTYAQVEGALAKVYSVDQQYVSRLRARYKHFQKLGLPERRPGTGVKEKFKLNEFCEILLAMELSEFGFDPQVIVLINIEFGYSLDNGNSVLSALLTELVYFPYPDLKSQRYVVFEPKAMSFRWLPEEAKPYEFPVNFIHSIVYEDDVEDAVKKRQSSCVINLSSLAERAFDALKPYTVVRSDGDT